MEAEQTERVCALPLFPSYERDAAYLLIPRTLQLNSPQTRPALWSSISVRHAYSNLAWDACWQADGTRMSYDSTGSQQPSNIHHSLKSSCRYKTRKRPEANNPRVPFTSRTGSASLLATEPRINPAQSHHGFGRATKRKRKEKGHPPPQPPEWVGGGCGRARDDEFVCFASQEPNRETGLLGGRSYSALDSDRACVVLIRAAARQGRQQAQAQTSYKVQVQQKTSNTRVEGARR